MKTLRVNHTDDNHSILQKLKAGFTFTCQPPRRLQSLVGAGSVGLLSRLPERPRQWALPPKQNKQRALCEAAQHHKAVRPTPKSCKTNQNWKARRAQWCIPWGRMSKADLWPLHMHTHAHTCMWVHTTHTSTHIYTCTHMYTIHMHTHEQTCTHVVHIHTHHTCVPAQYVHTFIHTCTHTYIHACMNSYCYWLTFSF